MRGILSGLELFGVMASCSSPVREPSNAPVAVQTERATEQGEDAVRSYLSLVFQKLESYKRYPRIAERNGLGGRVVLRFTVRWDGEVIMEVTGHMSFGDAALWALKRVGHLPRSPMGFSGATYWWKFPSPMP